MSVPTAYFTDFLKEIRLTRQQRDDAKAGHETLRKRLIDDDDLGPRIVSTFLQGSYRRSTAIRPVGDAKSDVDVVVVTNVSEQDYTPEEALELFRPFLNKHYSGRYKPQGRSYGITLSTVELDLVVTSAPSSEQLEALGAGTGYPTQLLFDDTPVEELPATVAKAWSSMTEQASWKLEPLRIPDRDTNAWEDTDPLKQISWTIDKNAACNGHYVNVVKAIKWWQRLNSADIPRPKGYPLEHLIGDTCPNGITSVEEGVARTFRSIIETFRAERASGEVPYLADRGTSNNVMHRIDAQEFCSFYDKAVEALELADEAYGSEDICHAVRMWRVLFGDKFPAPPSNCDEGQLERYTTRSSKSQVRHQRFA